MNKGQGLRMIPEYLLDFMKDIYVGKVPDNYGRILVPEAFVKFIETAYNYYSFEIPRNKGNRLVPEYLYEFFKDVPLIDYTDRDIKYQKIVPNNVFKYAEIIYIGGMSYKSDNLLVFEDVAETTTSSGITYSVINGILSFKNTPVSNTSIWLKIKDFKTISGTSYGFKTFNNRPETNMSIALRKEYNVSTDGINLNISGNIFTGNNNVYKYFLVYITTGFNDSELILKPDTIVSTSTPTEWVEGYEGIRDSAVTSIKINDNIVRTIPEAVQALEGYGWGINEDCYNNINYVGKLFEKNVAKAVLDGVNYSVDYSPVTTNNYLYRTTIVNAKSTPTASTTANAISDSEWVATYWNNIRYGNEVSYGIAVTTNSKEIWISFPREEDYNTTEKVNTWLQSHNLTIYYELDEPVETDVSEYIKESFLEVHDGDVITFENEYKADIPSAIEYLVEV